MIIKNIDNYIRLHATVIKEGVDNEAIQIDDKLLNDYKDGVTDLCLILYPDMPKYEIGLRVDKIFADVLGME